MDRYLMSETVAKDLLNYLSEPHTMAETTYRLKSFGVTFCGVVDKFTAESQSFAGKTGVGWIRGGVYGWVFVPWYHCSCPYVMERRDEGVDVDPCDLHPTAHME